MASMEQGDSAKVFGEILSRLEASYRILDDASRRLNCLVFSFDHVPLAGMGEERKQDLSMLQVQVLQEIRETLVTTCEDVFFGEIEVLLNQLVPADAREAAKRESLLRLIHGELKWIMTMVEDVQSVGWKENRRVMEQALGKFKHQILLMILLYYPGRNPVDTIKDLFPTIYKNKSKKYSALKFYLKDLVEFLAHCEKQFGGFANDPWPSDHEALSLLCRDLRARFDAMMASLNSLTYSEDNPDRHSPLRDLFYSDLQDIHSINLVIPRVCQGFLKSVECPDGETEAVRAAESLEVHLNGFGAALNHIYKGVGNRLLRF